jgi:RimJ/RimL family protein N-acetyltransferase
VTLTARRVRPTDVGLLWEWRNDETVRRQSFSTDPIPWEHHERWFAARLASADTVIYVLEDGDRPIAQVRYERRDPGTAEVGDVSVAAASRGRGYGRAALAETVSGACRTLSVETVVALVKEENVASHRAFVGAGFEPTGSVVAHGVACRGYRYRRDPRGGA